MLPAARSARAGTRTIRVEVIDHKTPRLGRLSVTVNVVAALGMAASLVTGGCGGTLEDDYRRRQQSPAETPTTGGGTTIGPMGGNAAGALAGSGS